MELLITLVCDEDSIFTSTNWSLLYRFDSNQSSAVPLRPRGCSYLCNKILLLRVFNAVLRSNRAIRGMSPLSEAKKRSWMETSNKPILCR